MGTLRSLIGKLYYFSVTMMCLVGGASQAWAGSIFLTGHDPDFHHATGITTAAINFVTAPAFNPFAAQGADKFLFVQSKGSIPSGHVNGVSGIIDSGYTLGVDFDYHDFTTLDAALDQLGTTYDAIVVASDFGGILRQAELDILISRSSDIISFLNAGGGLFAMAESNTTGLTPNGGHFGFLPFVVSSTQFNQLETGVTVTPFGASLGLTNADVNGNFSHNIFVGDFGLNVVDRDQFGNILSLAGRGIIDDGGVGGGGDGTVPEPGTFFLFGCGLIGLTLWYRRRSA